MLPPEGSVPGGAVSRCAYGRSVIIPSFLAGFCHTPGMGSLTKTQIREFKQTGSQFVMRVGNVVVLYRSKVKAEAPVAEEEGD